MRSELARGTVGFVGLVITAAIVIGSNSKGTWDLDQDRSLSPRPLLNATPLLERLFHCKPQGIHDYLRTQQRRAGGHLMQAQHERAKPEKLE